MLDLAFVRSNLDHVAERERILLLGHAGVIYHLQQEIAELVPKVIQIAARDGISDLIGFIDGVGRDRRKILLEVPGAAAIERSRTLGATRVFLGTNSKLGPAVHLYEQAGFVRITRDRLPVADYYARADILMELGL